MSEATTQTSAVRTSRTGKRPIALPKGVTLTQKGQSIEIKGPKGTLTRSFPTEVAVKVDGGNVSVTANATGSDAARLQGTARSHLNNMVIGASEGYTKTLELVGTGYRAELKGNVLHFALGLSHPVSLALPGDIKAQIPADSKGTLVILTGSDKDLMGQTAAKIRSFRPPEPYGGKGVRYKGENVRRKAGKAGKGGKGGGKGGKLCRCVSWVASGGSSAFASGSAVRRSVRASASSARPSTSTPRSSTTRPGRPSPPPAPSRRIFVRASARTTRPRRRRRSASTSPTSSRRRTSPRWSSIGTATSTTAASSPSPRVLAKRAWTF